MTTLSDCDDITPFDGTWIARVFTGPFLIHLAMIRSSVGTETNRFLCRLQQIMNQSPKYLDMGFFSSLIGEKNGTVKKTDF